MQLNDKASAAVIAALSLSEDQVKSLNESGNFAAIISERDTKTREEYKSALANDEAFIKPFKDEGYKAAQGFYLNQARKDFLKATGLSESDIKRDDGRYMELEEIYNLGKTKLTAGSSEDLKKLQTDMIAARKEAERIKEAKDAELQALKASYEQEGRARTVKEKSSHIISEFENLAVPANAALPYILAEIDGLEKSFAETGDLELKTKSGLQLQKPGGTELFKSTSEYFGYLLEKGGFLKKEETKKDIVSNPITVQGGNGNDINKPLSNSEYYLQQAKLREQQLKKDSGLTQ